MGKNGLTLLLWYLCFWGFPGGSDGKETACNVGDLGSIPESGISPGEGNGYPLQSSCLENSMDREAQWATIHGVAKNRTWLPFSHFHFCFLRIAAHKVKQFGPICVDIFVPFFLLSPPSSFLPSFHFFSLPFLPPSSPFFFPLTFPLSLFFLPYFFLPHHLFSPFIVFHSQLLNKQPLLPPWGMCTAFFCNPEASLSVPPSLLAEAAFLSALKFLAKKPIKWR